MVLREAEDRLTSAAQAHSAAIERACSLLESAEKARTAANEAAMAGDKMLVCASTGEADVTDDALLEAADRARRAQAIADVASAKAAASRRHQQQAQIGEITARAAVLQDTYERTVTRWITLADEVDQAYAHLCGALATFNEHKAAVQAAYSAGIHHNSLELHPGHHQNPILNAMHPSVQPKVHLPQVAPSIHPQVELYANNGYGWNAKRALILNLADRLRQMLDRTVSASA